MGYANSAYAYHFDSLTIPRPPRLVAGAPNPIARPLRLTAHNFSLTARAPGPIAHSFGPTLVPSTRPLELKIKTSECNPCASISRSSWPLQSLL